MTLRELMDVMDYERLSEIVVQVVIDPEDSWTKCDVLHANSHVLRLLEGRKVTGLEAVGDDVIRVSLEDVNE